MFGGSRRLIPKSLNIFGGFSKTRTDWYDLLRYCMIVGCAWTRVYQYERPLNSGMHGLRIPEVLGTNFRAQ